MRSVDKSVAESKRQVVVTGETVGPSNTATGMVKTWPDLDRYRALIGEAKPDGVLEIGTLWGTSALWFALRFGLPVLTVDINPQVSDDIRGMAQSHGVEFVTGASTSLTTIETVATWAGRVRSPLVVLDGDHNADTVRQELDLYARLVAPGGYVVVEDTLLRWCDDNVHNGSPMDAVDAWLPDHPDFEPDMALEDLYETTQHPGGWLRRKGRTCA